MRRNNRDDNGRGNKYIAVDEAEAIAITGLGFLGQDSGRFENFLAATGVNPGDLRALAGTSPFLVSVLDFLLQDESLLLIFTSENSLDPEMIKPARYRLSGDEGS